MASDNPFQEAVVRETVEPSIPGIARRGRKHQRQRGRVARLAITLLQGNQQFVRRSDADIDARSTFRPERTNSPLTSLLS